MSLIRYQSPSLSSWRSFDRWANLREELNNLFETPAWSQGSETAQLFHNWTPALDLYQTADEIVAVVELPGMKKEEIDLSLHDGALIIGGERKEAPSTSDRHARSERFVGKFRRSVSLPTQVDANKVNASYKDGILTITLPKAEEVKPKQIQVS